MSRFSSEFPNYLQGFLTNLISTARHNISEKKHRQRIASLKKRGEYGWTEFIKQKMSNKYAYESRKRLLPLEMYI